jgi:hypothetical protein
MSNWSIVRPADVCRQLLTALDASEGRRRKRKRNTTPDSIGMAMKRTLLEETVQQNPNADDYEQWLLEYCLASGELNGAMRAMALEVFYDWQLAQKSAEFRSWLEQSAPSDDAAL